MFRIISALILAATAACAFAQEKLTLVDNPPDRHVVVPGDTLWGISGKFLKDPWRWPQIWRLNKEQIKNPHRIYPGDIVVLDLSGSQPQLRIGRPLALQPQVYSEAERQEIPSIPAAVIEPFISRPLVVSEDELKDAPRILAGPEDRFFIGGGDKAYVSGITDDRVIRWSVYRPGKVLKDLDTDEVLGYEAFDLGNAVLTQIGEPSTVKITMAREEMSRGDRLIPAPQPDIVAYVPQAPEQRIAGRIIAVYGGLGEAGRYSVITLNRGTRDGLARGHVLALYRHQTAFGRDENDQRIDTVLPDERYGLVFVFRTFDRLAYALVMEATKSVIIGDTLKNP